MKNSSMPINIKKGSIVHHSAFGMIGILQDNKNYGDTNLLVFADRSIRVNGTESGWFVETADMNDATTPVSKGVAKSHQKLGITSNPKNVTNKPLSYSGPASAAKNIIGGQMHSVDRQLEHNLTKTENVNKDLFHTHLKNVHEQHGVPSGAHVVVVPGHVEKDFKLKFSSANKGIYLGSHDPSNKFGLKTDKGYDTGIKSGKDIRFSGKTNIERLHAAYSDVHNKYISGHHDLIHHTLKDPSTGKEHKMTSFVTLKGHTPKEEMEKTKVSNGDDLFKTINDVSEKRYSYEQKLTQPKVLNRELKKTVLSGAAALNASPDISKEMGVSERPKDYLVSSKNDFLEAVSKAHEHVKSLPEREGALNLVKHSNILGNATIKATHKQTGKSFMLHSSELSEAPKLLKAHLDKHGINNHEDLNKHFEWHAKINLNSGNKEHNESAKKYISNLGKQFTGMKSKGISGPGKMEKYLPNPNTAYNTTTPEFPHPEGGSNPKIEGKHGFQAAYGFKIGKHETKVKTDWIPLHGVNEVLKHSKEFKK